MRRKTMSRKGFTLAETLIVIFILALMTSAGAVGVSAVLASRQSMIQAADAEILGSTAFQAVANELRFGQNIQVNGDNVVLDSITYGPGTKILLDTDGKLKYAKDGKEKKDILADHAYSGLEITKLAFTQGAEGAITIDLTVSGSRGELWSEEVSVVPLNGPETETS